MFLGPRFAFLIYWLIAPVRVNAAFVDFNFSWLVGLLGLVFVPWTVLMYVLVYPMANFDWIWVGLALAGDIATYAGGTYKRKSVPYYPESAP
jgi:hypothetical protein